MKRFIALVLTLSMCLSVMAFVPTASAADAVSTEYSFSGKQLTIEPLNSPWHTSTNWEGLDFSDDIKKFYDPSATEVVYDNNITFAADVMNTKKSKTMLKHAQDEIMSGLKAGFLFRGQVGNLVTAEKNYGTGLIHDAWIALKLDAPAECGKYDLTFALTTSSSAAKCDIFFAPYVDGENDGEYYIKNGTQVASNISMKGTEASSVTAEGIEIDEVGENEHYVLIVRLNTNYDGGKTNYDKTIQFSSITLTKTGELAPVAPPTVAYGTNIDGVISVNGTGIARGTEVTVTAPEITGKVFRHWVLGTEENGAWVSDLPSYTFPLMTNTYLTAVYAPAPAEDEKIVEFFNYNGEYLTQKTVEEDGTVALPTEEPSLTGYEFSRWLIAKNTPVTEETVFTNAITRVVAELTAIGSYTVNGEDYTYNDEIPYSADEDVAWYRDDVLVGYGETYSYFVWNSVGEIKSEQITGEKTPIVVLDESVKDGKACMIEYDAAGKTIKEVGILFGSTDKIDINSCDSKGTSQRNEAHGQFTAKPRTNGNASYARGYIIYEDEGLQVKYTEALALN